MTRQEPNDDDIATADEILADALANGVSYADAGRVVGVSARTVRRRMQIPAFRTRAAERRAENLTIAAGRIMSLLPDALRVVEVALQDQDVHVQLKAARQIVDQVAKLDRAAAAHESITRPSDEKTIELIEVYAAIARSVMSTDQRLEFIERQRTDPRMCEFRRGLGIPDPDPDDDGLLPPYNASDDP